MTFHKRFDHLALGRLPVGQLNKTEQRYSNMLEGMKAIGGIQWYRFEGLKLRLADNTFYTPDFVVMRDDSIIECHEVKGFWRDDARVKIKVAAETYPFRFYAVKELPKSRGGGYEYEAFNSSSLSSQHKNNDPVSTALPEISKPERENERRYRR